MTKDFIWIVWDLGAIILLIWCVYRGAKNGFLRSAVSAFSYVIGAVVGSVFGPRIAAWAYASFIQNRIREMVGAAVNNAFAEGAQSLTDVLQALPSWLQSFVSPYISGGQTANIQENARESILMAVETAVKQPITWLIGALVFIVLFLVVAFAIRQLGKLLSGVNRIPLLGGVNMLLGGVLGVVQAAALLLLMSVILSLAVTLTGGQYWWLTDNVLRSTFILGVFYRFISSVPVTLPI